MMGVVVVSVIINCFMIYLIRRLLHSIGDAICMEPLISLTHELVYPHGGEIWFQCNDRIAEFFRHHPLIKQILLDGQVPPADIQTVLDISTGEQCPSIRALMSGGKFNATELFCDASIVDGQPLVYDGRSPRLYFSDEEKQRINFIRRSIPKKKVALQVKAGHWWKAYPHLKTLAELLGKQEDIQLFLTNDEPIPFKTPGMIPLVRLPYRDLMVWLGVMDLFIGLDSGPTHVAAAVGTRTYAIFGPTDPEIILGMYGEASLVSWNKFSALNCPRKRCWLRPCKKVLCLRALSPFEIMSAVKKILVEDYENPRLRVSVQPYRPERGIGENQGFGVQETASGSWGLMPKSVALMRLDGLGGTLTLSDQAKKIHEQTGQKVTLITRGYEVIFENNPHIKEVVNVGMRDWKECSLIMRSNYDNLAEIRFGLGKWFSPNGNYIINQQVYQPDFVAFTDQLFNQFPKNYNQLRGYGLHHIQLTDMTLGLPYDTIDSEIFLDDERFDISEDDFILVNNGVDVIHRGMRQTKCWEKWDELVPLLPMKVVQVGTLNDPPIEGVIDLRGQTNLKQLIYLIKKATSIIVTEGGIMHVAYAVKNPNVVVLGGPTQGPLFEYPGHRWVTSYVCGDCWSTTDDWYARCPKGTDAVCMRSISPQRVAEEVGGRKSEVRSLQFLELPNGGINTILKDKILIRMMQYSKKNLSANFRELTRIKKY